jgi:hypothetical protein
MESATVGERGGLKWRTCSRLPSWTISRSGDARGDGRRVGETGIRLGDFVAARGGGPFGGGVPFGEGRPGVGLRALAGWSIDRTLRIR